MAGRGPGPLPPRWLNCPRKSNGLIGVRFVAFKTPLDDRFDDQLEIAQQFSPEMVLQLYKEQRPKMTLWIDLTNTTRFYNRRVVESFNCKYMKLKCRGHGEAPTQDQTQSFIELVDGHLQDNPFDLVGVHCTHGFNRTGFLIASYLVERMDYSVAAALMEFANARPPGIYKQDYIEELFRRYDDVDDMIAAPERPDWCFEDDEDAGSDNEQPTQFQGNNVNDTKRPSGEIGADHSAASTSGTASGSASNGGGGGVKRRRIDMVNPNAQFMSGVNGVELILDQSRVTELQQKVQDFCHWTKGGFPGAQPVSMDRENLKFLQTKPYRVSWKADGSRYMMLICGEDQIYFFGRDFQCFRVHNLRFVHKQDLQRSLSDTLLDGEMVIDRSNGVSRPRYLVYDVIHFEDEDVGSQTFDTRLNYIKHQIVFPRYEAMKQGIINKTHEPFSVAVKDFWDVTQAAALLSPKFTKQLLHEPDGLIFQPAKEHYQAGQCDDILKWKPTTMNSIDFRIRITVEQGEG